MVGQPRLLRPRTALIVAAAALLTLWVTWVSLVGALFAKALIDPFFHSTSAGAALALLALVTLGAASLAVTRGPRSASAARMAAAVLMGGIVLGNATNLWAHLQLLRDAALPWTLAVYHWAGDTNTYSYVLHSHAGKAALHALFSGWSAHLFRDVDIGAGLAARMAPEWGAICLVSLIGAVAAYVWLLPAVAARWSGWPMPLLFTYAALNGIKTIVDGGPLTYRFAPVLAVLLWMLPSALRLGNTFRVGGSATALLCLTASGMASAALAGAQIDEARHGLMSTAAVIGLLGACAWRPSNRWANWLRRGVGLTCAATLARDLAASLMATPLALLAPLPAGTEATICDTLAGTCARQPVTGRRALDVYRNAGDDPLKPHHTLIAPAQSVGGSRLLLAIHPLSTQRATRRVGQAVSVQPVTALPHGAGVLVQAESTTLPTIFNAAPSAFSASNYYVFLHQAAAQLRAQGLADYVMAPVRNSADARALGMDATPAGATP